VCSDSTAESVRLRKTGLAQTRKALLTASAPSAPTTPSSTWPRWARQASRLLSSTPSRRCGLQPLSRPTSTSATATACISIITGVISIEATHSTAKPSQSRPAPPKPRRVAGEPSARVSAIAFGAASSASVNTKSAITLLYAAEPTASRCEGQMIAPQTTSASQVSGAR